MAIYSTFGKLFGKAPYIPSIKVTGWNIHDKFYSSGGDFTSNDTTTDTGGGGPTTTERAQLLAKIEFWLKLGFQYSYNKLVASDPTVVSNQDLAFILEVCQNVSAYCTDERVLYFTLDAKSIFKLEVIEYILRGYSPNDALKMAAESLKTEKFVSGEPKILTINNMSAQQKNKLNEVAGQSSYSQGDEKAEEEPVEEPEPKKNNPWLIAGVLILILTTK